VPGNCWAAHAVSQHTCSPPIRNNTPHLLAQTKTPPLPPN